MCYLTPERYNRHNPDYGTFHTTSLLSSWTHTLHGGEKRWRWKKEPLYQKFLTAWDFCTPVGHFAVWRYFWLSQPGKCSWHLDTGLG